MVTAQQASHIQVRTKFEHDVLVYVLWSLVVQWVNREAILFVREDGPCSHTTFLIKALLTTNVQSAN